jgi:hypothetical protein
MSVAMPVIGSRPAVMQAEAHLPFTYMPGTDTALLSVPLRCMCAMCGSQWCAGPSTLAARSSAVLHWT